MKGLRVGKVRVPAVVSALLSLLVLTACFNTVRNTRAGIGADRDTAPTPVAAPTVALDVDYSSTVATAGDGFGIVAQIGGAIRAVAARDTYVYFGMGPRVHALDVSQPEEPVHVAWSKVLPGVVEAIALDGTVAYVATGSGGLVLLDLDEDPLAIVGDVRLPGSAVAVAAAGGYAYVAAEDEGLRVVEVSDPARPREVGTFDVQGKAIALDVNGDLVFVVENGRDAALRVVDVTEPRSPRQAGRYPVDGSARDVDVADGIAYFATAREGLLAIDARQPSWLRRLGAFNRPGYANSAGTSLQVDGDLAYVAARRLLGEPGGLSVLDVSRPLKMREAGRHYAHGWLDADLAVVGQLVVAATDDAGLQAFDVSEPDRPTRAWHVEEYGDAWSVDIVDAHVVVSDNNWTTNRGTLRIVDASDPLQPKNVARLQLRGPVRTMVAESENAYLGVDSKGLVIVDVSDAASPGVVGRTAVTVGELSVRDATVYVASSQRLHAIDVTTPAAPVRTMSVDVPGEIEDVFVLGSHVFLSTRTRGLQLVDLTQPRNPKIAGTVRGLNGVGDMLVLGNRAIVTGSGPLRVVDLLDPLEPMELGRTKGAVAGGSASHSGQFVVATNWEGRVDLVDVSNPYAPTMVRGFQAPAPVRDVASSDDFAILAADDAGLIVVQLPMQTRY